MKLYCSKTSPYSRKVRVVVHELGMQERIQEVLADPFNPSPELLAANPLSKIPTLVTGRGLALPDSRLIIQYLERRSHKLPDLSRGRAGWMARRRQHLAEGIIDAAAASVLEKRRPEGIIYTTFLDRQAAIIARTTAALNAEASQLRLEEPSMVEICAGVALAYLDFRLPYLEWRRGHEALALWLDHFAQRPSMQATYPSAA